jgi:hypothetical protein
LSQFKIPAGYLDLNGVEADRAAKKVITEYKGFRQFGAAFNPTYNYYSYRPAFLMFDGLFFFDKTTSAVPN